MARVKSEAFDLRESQLKGTHADIRTYEDLALWLSNELDTALGARGNVHEQIKYNWTLYTQGRTRGTNAPWPDAADLTSPFAAEYVDAYHARVMQTIFTEPVWTVEGWGESAKRAPFVEEFHQRTQEDERLQTWLDKTILRAWLEPAGILEIAENVEFERVRKRIKAKLQLDPATGLPIMGEDGTPVMETNPETGEPVEAGEQDQATADVEADFVEPVRSGPAYDVIPYLDFLTLPHHAKDSSQVWGYAKRFWRRPPELKARAAQGVYDKKAVEAIGEQDERGNVAQEAPSQPIIAEQRGPTAQIELFELPFKADLDGKGERWYRATLHKDKRILLRLKFDDRTTRYFKFVPFPKPDSTDGWTLVGDKLITVIEEDTAVRNMRADKAALAISAPVLKRQGALWDEYEQPFGPRSVITVRDKDELTQMQLSDVPDSINRWKVDVRNDADRLAGQNDTSLGQESSGSQTLGEIRLKAGYVEVRTDLIIKRFKEPLEELGQARHTIYLRHLGQMQQGMPMPSSMVMGLEARGVDVQSIVHDGRITADMLSGQFWFKPRGSVESADLNAQMAYFNQFLATIPALMQVNPMFQMLFGSPMAAKSIVEQALRVFRWPDKQAFLGSEAQAMFTQQQEQASIMSDPRMQLVLAMANGGPGASAAMGPGGGAPALPPGSPQAGEAPPMPGGPMGVM